MMRQIPQIVRWLSQKLFVWRITSDEKTIYLSFDDGPTPDVTPQLLDLLDQYRTKASFFCLGENVEKYPDIFKEIKERGHSVGNHAYSHISGFKTGKKAYLVEVEKAERLIDSKLFRPPYGKIRLSQARALRKMGYRIIMWDVMSYDFDRKIQAEQIISEVKKRSRNGSIIVFHDTNKAIDNLFAVLPELLEFWQNNSYQLKAIE